MPFKLGLLEIILILVIVFIIFGAGKLPQIFETVGKGVKALRGEKKSGGTGGVKTTKEGKKKAAKG